MKTSMKKKALVSSVAMLSVASLALGTATYAWFTQSTQADAKNISLATSKNSALEISKVDKVWGTHLDYATNETLTPASSSDAINWFTGNAALPGEFTMDTKDGKPAATKLNSTTGYVFAEQINVKNSGSGEFGDVKLTITFNNLGGFADADARDYFRFAIVPVGETAKDVMGTPNTSDFKGGIYALTENTDDEGKAIKQTWNPITLGTDATAEINTEKYSATKVGAGNTIEITVGDDAEGVDYKVLGAGKAKYYNIYGWFEGQDDDCFDTNAGLTMPSITMDVRAGYQNGNAISYN